MSQFRKKPIVIEAQQFWPRGYEQHDPSMVTNRKGHAVSPPDYRQIGDLYLAFDENIPNMGGAVMST